MQDKVPAFLGGEPEFPQGAPDWPIVDEAVLSSLKTAYASGSWGKYHGDSIPALEEELKNYQGVDFALTCASGTLAVELALRGLRIGDGDEVILAAYDYPGNFLSIHAVGAKPVLAEVAEANWNLSTGILDSAITGKTKAILVSHLHGGLVPMRELREFAGRKNLPVIEDAAQCPGAEVSGKKVGTWGDAGIISFGGSKLLTAGRGGALLTNRPEIHQRARLGVMRGNNNVCPLSELQAAVLLPQLAKLDERNQLRLENVRFLIDLLGPVPGIHPFVNQDDASPAFFKLGFQYDPEKFGLSRDLFVAAMRAEGIAMDAGFRAAHLGRSANRYIKPMDLSEAEKAHHGTVILHHPVLLGSKEDMKRISQAINKVHRNAAHFS